MERLASVIKLFHRLALIFLGVGVILIFVYKLVYLLPYGGARLFGKEGVAVNRNENSGVLWVNVEKDPVFVYSLLNEHNKVRQANGLPHLTLSYELQKSAFLKALDIFLYQYWSHFNPKNKEHTPWFFIRSQAGNYLIAGENLARGFSSPKDLMETWMSSQSHRANILQPSFKYIGIARIHGFFNKKPETITVVHFVNSKNLMYTASESLPEVWLMFPNYNDPLYTNLNLVGVAKYSKELKFVLKNTDGSIAHIKVKPNIVTTNGFVFWRSLDDILVETAVPANSQEGLYLTETSGLLSLPLGEESLPISFSVLASDSEHLLVLAGKNQNVSEKSEVLGVFNSKRFFLDTIKRASISLISLSLMLSTAVFILFAALSNGFVFRAINSSRQYRAIIIETVLIFTLGILLFVLIKLKIGLVL